jgi:hypothetical protein
VAEFELLYAHRRGRGDCPAGVGIMSNLCLGPKPGLFFDLRQVWRGISRTSSEHCKDSLSLDGRALPDG